MVDSNIKDEGLECNSKISNVPSSLELICNLLSALSHKLRTPLSVIKNDLSYFQSVLPVGECDRSLRKCDEISALLHELALEDVSKKTAQVNLHSIVSAVFGEKVKAQVTQCVVTTNQSILRTLLQLLANYFQGQLACSLAAVEVVFVASKSVILLTFNTTSQANSSNVFNSLTRYVSAENRVESPIVPLIDALVAEINAAISVTTGEQTKVEIQL